MYGGNWKYNLYMIWGNIFITIYNFILFHFLYSNILISNTKSDTEITFYRFYNLSELSANN